MKKHNARVASIRVQTIQDVKNLVEYIADKTDGHFDSLDNFAEFTVFGKEEGSKLVDRMNEAFDVCEENGQDLETFCQGIKYAKDYEDNFYYLNLDEEVLEY